MAAPRKSRSTRVIQWVDGVKRCSAKKVGKPDKRRVYSSGQEASHSPNPSPFCMNPAGFGTDHPGYGTCKWHWGCTQNGSKVALIEEMNELVEIQQRLGDGIVIDPADALLQALWRQHGFVKYLEMLAAKYEMAEPDLVRDTEQGTAPRAWVDVYQEANMKVARIAKMCLEANIAERKVRLAESQGEMVARTFMNMMGDLMLSAEQRALAPAIFRRHMLALGNVLDAESVEVASDGS